MNNAKQLCRLFRRNCLIQNREALWQMSIKLWIQQVMEGSVGKRSRLDLSRWIFIILAMKVISRRMKTKQNNSLGKFVKIVIFPQLIQHVPLAANATPLTTEISWSQRPKSMTKPISLLTWKMPTSNSSTTKKKKSKQSPSSTSYAAKKKSKTT